MFRHLLVPLDGSRTAELVLPVARFFCETTGAAVTLLHVVERYPRPTVHHERHLTNAAEAKQYLEQIGKEAFPTTATIEYHVHDPGVGDVALSITAHADEMQADLIALCTHGRGALSRFLFGTIAQQVLANASQPVLLVPHQLQQWEGPYACRRILVPVDVGGGHEEGISLALDLAATCRAEVNLVAAVPTLGTLSTERAAAAQVLPTSASMLLEIEQNEAYQELSRRMESARKQGLQVKSELVRGRVAEAIVEAAKRLKPDLIVMATHRRKGLDALMSGSVGAAICAASPVCLLIAPISPSAGTRA